MEAHVHSEPTQCILGWVCATLAPGLPGNVLETLVIDRLKSFTVGVSTRNIYAIFGKYKYINMSSWAILTVNVSFHYCNRYTRIFCFKNAHVQCNLTILALIVIVDSRKHKANHNSVPSLSWKTFMNFSDPHDIYSTYFGMTTHGQVLMEPKGTTNPPFFTEVWS